MFATFRFQHTLLLFKLPLFAGVPFWWSQRSQLFVFVLCSTHACNHQHTGEHIPRIQIDLVLTSISFSLGLQQGRGWLQSLEWIVGDPPRMMAKKWIFVRQRTQRTRRTKRTWPLQYSWIIQPLSALSWFDQWPGSWRTSSVGPRLGSTTDAGVWNSWRRAVLGWLETENFTWFGIWGIDEHSLGMSWKARSFRWREDNDNYKLIIA